MTPIVISMSIFVLSFVLGYVWSYIIVYKNGFGNQKFDNRKISISRFFMRTRYAIGNFILMSLVTCVSLAIIGDSFFSFKQINLFMFFLCFFIILVVDDIWFYIIHRVMHDIPFLYKKIHIVHHKAIPPIPMDYLYAHPIEAMGASMGIVWGILVNILLFGNISIYVFTAYTIYRTLHEIAIHSGMEIVPEKWLGILGSSRHHYDHHKYLKGNYASGLVFLDKIFATKIQVKTEKQVG